MRTDDCTSASLFEEPTQHSKEHETAMLGAFISRFLESATRINLVRNDSIAELLSTQSCPSSRLNWERYSLDIQQGSCKHARMSYLLLSTNRTAPRIKRVDASKSSPEVNADRPCWQIDIQG